MPKITKSPLKVDIVGYTPHRQKAHWGLEHGDWEVWCLNDLYMQQLPPIDPKRVRWFEMHPWNERGPDGKPTTYSVDRAHIPVLRKLAQQGARVYISEPRPEEFPEAIVFPYKELYRYFGDKLGGRLKYFTNTISFQVALAIMEGATEIGIYGVDMMTGGGGGINNEYGYQRPSVEYWIAAAEFSGIPVTLPDEADILKTAFVYGDYAGNVWRTKLEYEQSNTNQGIKQMQAQIAEANNRLQQLIGRKATLDWEINTWLPGDEGSAVARAPMPHSHKIKADERVPEVALEEESTMMPSST